MAKADQSLKALIERGKERGFLTYEEVNDSIPEGTTSAEKIDRILLTLDEEGIELLDKADAQTRPSVAQQSQVEGASDEAAPVEAVERTDDPVRMYLTQMGEITPFQQRVLDGLQAPSPARYLHEIPG